MLVPVPPYNSTLSDLPPLLMYHFNIFVMGTESKPGSVHTPRSTVEVYNTYSFIFTHPQALMVCSDTGNLHKYSYFNFEQKKDGRKFTAFKNPKHSSWCSQKPTSRPSWILSKPALPVSLKSHSLRLTFVEYIHGRIYHLPLRMPHVPFKNAYSLNRLKLIMI